MKRFTVEINLDSEHYDTDSRLERITLQMELRWIMSQLEHRRTGAPVYDGNGKRCGEWKLETLDP